MSQAIESVQSGESYRVILGSSKRPATGSQARIAHYYTAARNLDWTTRLLDYQKWLQYQASAKEKHGKLWCECICCAALVHLCRYGSRTVATSTGSYDTERKRERENAVNAAMVPWPRGRQSADRSVNAGFSFTCRYDVYAVAKYKEERIGKEFHGFMYLPGEIRNGIYEAALFQGSVHLPRLLPEDQRTRSTHAPFQIDGYCLSLLYGPNHDRFVETRPRSRRRLGLVQGVSALVQHEAMGIFLGNNQLIFSGWDDLRLPRFFSLVTLAAKRNMPQSANGLSVLTQRDFTGQYWQYAPLVRDVAFTFDKHESPLCNEEHARQVLGTAADDSVLHDSLRADLQRLWSRRIDFIHRMRLDRLRLDIFEPCCSETPCELTVTLVELLVGNGTPFQAGKGRNPKVIEINGVNDHNERERMSSLLGRFGDKTKVFFDGRIWVPDMDDGQ